jgi:ABC-type lipoprotein export system ATPase subunit
MVMNASTFTINDKNVHIASTENPFVRLKDVVKEYRSDAGSFCALKGINLEVQAGEFLGIIGKSGAGKTTLLNIISAVDSLTSGEVWVGGTRVHALSQTQQSKWRGRTLGVVYQTFQLMSMLTLIDNVMLPIDFQGRYHPRKSVVRAMALLADLDIAQHAYKLPTQISGGQQQRVAIARALVNDPALILADEPTGSLDSATAASTMEILKRITQRGKTIIMATHDAGLIPYFTRTVILFDGEFLNETLARLFPTVNHQRLIEAGCGFSQFSVEPGQLIVSQGEALKGLYVIIRGSAHIFSGDGKATINPGGIFGHQELVAEKPCQASLVAGGTESTEIGLLARAEFLNLYYQERGFRKEIDMSGKYGEIVNNL